MAKRQKTKIFSFQGFDNAHYKTTAAYTRAVNALFDKATNDIADAASKEDYNPNKPFSFDDYPKTKARLQTTLKGLAKKMQAIIELGSRRQWLFACQKNDEFIASIFDTTKLTKGRLKKMQDRNLDALQTFQQRKVGGMNLSERVWKYTEQFKDQIEIGLDVGLGEGRSAQQLSRDLRQNLQDPNRLFRRVRDKRGNLHLSKAAKAFHPGTGVYRSSYKNAMRLTRSEVNMAYREADHLRWQQLDFIVGFEVHRSNREPQFKCKLCDRLVGRYPKWFKYKGFHPQCMCYAIPILMDEEDFDNQELSDLKSALKGTAYKKLSAKNEVTDFPDGFKEWVAENAPKQAGWATTPYFIKDNFVDGDLSKGLRYVSAEETPKIDPIQQELDTLQQAIAEAKKISSEWGISTSSIDNALSARNPSAVKTAIVALNAEVETLKSSYNAFVLDVTKTTQEANKVGVDFTDVLNDLNTLMGNKAQWKLGQSVFKQHLQDLKNRITQTLSNANGERTEAQRANEKEVAGLLKVKQKQDMSFDEANELRGNPNYQQEYIPDPNGIYRDKQGNKFSKNPSYKKKFTINCQSCVVANELRRRGLDVEAQGNTKRKGSIPTMLSYHTELAWVDENGQTPTSQRTYGANVLATLTNLDTLTKEQGRYHIKWQWNSGRGGHIITCERLVDGTMRYYDPQNGKVITDFSTYASRFNLSSGIKVLRVDTLQINKDLISGVVSKRKKNKD